MTEAYACLRSARMTDAADDIEGALMDLALGRSEEKTTRLEKRVDDTGEETRSSTVSKATRPPSMRALEALMSRRVGGPQDWC